MGGRKHKKSGKKKNGVAIAASAKKSRKRRTSLKISNHDVVDKLAKIRLTPSQSGVMRIFANSNKASAKLFKRRPNISSQDLEDRFAKMCLTSSSQSCPDFHGIGQMNNDNNSIIGSNTMKEHGICIR